ncbi:helix-turn-helix domain-containing protein [Anaerosporobacter faecicola]|uniref:helix-turn-helix domain-containing protein n=1 Tax=Anaerosporobacter faecicola TaxID=2718714 RepID=UPI00143C14AB|nr:helix-turn-helix transcriptional regulator [Anaerosporobacter faecicola]
MKIDITKLMLLIANKGLSSTELSKLSGISTVTLCRIKNGSQVARPQTLGKIAMALGCKVEDFIED